MNLEEKQAELAELREQLDQARARKLKAYRWRVETYKVYCAANAAWMDASVEVQAIELDLRALREELGFYPEHEPAYLVVDGPGNQSPEQEPQKEPGL